MLIHDNLDLLLVSPSNRGKRTLVDVDGPISHKRLVQRHIPGDLEPAHQGPHQRDNRRVTGGTRDPKVKLVIEMQETILVLQEETFLVSAKLAL
jgi:hypothetical protein